MTRKENLEKATRINTLKAEIHCLQRLMLFLYDRYKKGNFKDKQYIQNINTVLDDIQVRQNELYELEN